MPGYSAAAAKSSSFIENSSSAPRAADQCREQKYSVFHVISPVKNWRNDASLLFFICIVFFCIKQFKLFVKVRSKEAILNNAIFLELVFRMFFCDFR